MRERAISTAPKAMKSKANPKKQKQDIRQEQDETETLSENESQAPVTQTMWKRTGVQIHIKTT